MSKKILLADDGVTIQKVVELTLEAAGFDVTSVGSGDEALARLAESWPDMVIADVHMPGASGFEVARKVKSERPELPVLLLVGTFEPFDPEEAKASGADGRLEKPFDAEELLRLVEQWTADGPQQRSGMTSDASGAPPVAGRERPKKHRAADPEPEPVARAEAAVPAPAAGISLSPEQLEAVARRVAELIDERILRDVAWEVIPDLAEIVIRERLRELEAQVEPADS